MFRQLIYENCLSWVPWLAFAATASIYFICTIRAMRLRTDKLRQMARLPLDD
ncbi:MAG TPA: hypothetical protein VGE39_25670 [Prosthecobacter sp.]